VDSASDRDAGFGAPTSAPQAVARSRPRQTWRSRALKRLLDLAVAVPLVVVGMPLLAIIALAIKIDSRGPIFYRSRRVGFRGRSLEMLKFRKMVNGASGPAVTVANDARLTRCGRLLASTKLDEIPQLWHVVKGDMSLVGPRPEDPQFVALYENDYRTILAVKPGITGLCQLAFAKESEVLEADDRLTHYVERLLPQKAAMDELYATQRSLGMDLRILVWTALAVLLRRDVAVHRGTGRLGLRRRTRVASVPVLPAEPEPVRAGVEA
jgi:lipopolysaccharide/colanic/teichoic acid biosynthesis glycosyltransferase